MASNSFGNIFRITTWGESHGKAMGVVIDGCPAGLDLSIEDIQLELSLRQPGRNSYTSPRKEEDRAEIYSGIFEGKTTGAPISIIIFNLDADSSKYASVKQMLRPGHANYTYLKKYAIFDYRGGGRASGRETVCRVAAGAVAKKLLAHYQIQLAAYIKEIGTYSIGQIEQDVKKLKSAILESPIFCPDPQAAQQMMQAILDIKEEKDSLGGVVELITNPLPVGLGDPIYEKLQANLAKALFSMPAIKGFEIGSGFEAAKMQGSLHNDPFALNADGEVVTKSNHAGGLLGGITTGMPLILRAAFKPPSSIQKPQQTLTLDKEEAQLQLPEGSRHDPCIAIRAVPVVEAMCALVLADSLLMDRSSKIS